MGLRSRVRLWMLCLRDGNLRLRALFTVEHLFARCIYKSSPIHETQTGMKAYLLYVNDMREQI